MIPTTDQWKKQLNKKLSDISEEIKEAQINEKKKLESEKGIENRMLLIGKIAGLECAYNITRMAYIESYELEVVGADVELKRLSEEHLALAIGMAQKDAANIFGKERCLLADFIEELKEIVERKKK